MEMKNKHGETWAFCAAAAIWTEACNGLEWDLLEHVPKKLLKELYIRKKIDQFNKIINRAIVEIDTREIDFYYDRAETFGFFNVRGCRFCYPPKWLVKDMNEFEETEFITLEYMESIKSIFRHI